ncbi:MAG TPA: dihydrolipoyl dehydrogenase [Rhizomicrobium sp.]|jgi:dihydrolipoamide dehydrogenase|nr:dihydrolipoyl dehydrogenase [Rhizomicrobium sp.]
MPETITTRVLVVGAGPGGYVAAIRAGQLGLETTLVESERLGGTCLIKGCIPSKAMIHVAGEFETMHRATGKKGRHGVSLASPPALDMPELVRWKEGIVTKLSNGVAALCKRAKVRVLSGRAHFSDARTCIVEGNDNATITAEHVILANGSVSSELPFLPFGGPVISSSEALSLEALPEKLVVIGAGYIGLELGIALRKLGSQVTIVEALDRILPLFDSDLSAPVKKWLDRNGVTVHLGATAKGLMKENNSHALAIQTKDGKTEHLPADKILVTVGRKPHTGGWGLENMGVDKDGRFVRVDDQCRTSMKNVWAIGDLVGEPLLAHKAMAQGEMVAEIIAGHKRRFAPVAIAAVCFTEPEIVTAGVAPGDPATANIDIISASFPFAANGRALSMDAGDEGGFVRVLARRDDHRILGIQAVGAHVSELAGEFALALEMGALLEDIAGTIHVHPTLGEAFHETALRTLGHALHI